MTTRRPKLAVYKFASCDGCQLQLLDLEGQLRRMAEQVEIAHFLEARSRIEPGPYDVGLVEGSISTSEDIDRIREIRQQCRHLIAIGACATAGGIQALRNWGNDNSFLSGVYASPDYIDTLATSTAIADHVPVDFELRGCPIDPGQLLEVLTAFLLGRSPSIPRYSVCIECKQQQTVCVAVARGISCLGPVTQAGCNALCPAHGRECFGCYGPNEQPNLVSLTGFYKEKGADRQTLGRLVQSFNAWAPEFREAAKLLADPADKESQP